MLAGSPTMPLLPTLTLVGAGWASGGSSGPAGPSCVLDVVFAALWAGLVYMLRASCSYAWSCFTYVVTVGFVARVKQCRVKWLLTTIYRSKCQDRAGYGLVPGGMPFSETATQQTLSRRQKVVYAFH